MDLNWAQASLCFPNCPRFCGQTFLDASDRDLALLWVRAYNDWMVDEWCAPSDGRLVPLCLVRLWDPLLAAAEIERNASRGVRAVAFSEIPAYLGLPSIHSGEWDPFFAACEATGTVLCLHIGSGTKMPTTSPDAPPGVQVTIGYGNCMNSLADWLFSGKLEQFPGLRPMYAESQIGWIPYLLERADEVWMQHHAWVSTGGEISQPPSASYYRQVPGCFFRDHHGMASLEAWGRRFERGKAFAQHIITRRADAVGGPAWDDISLRRHALAGTDEMALGAARDYRWSLQFTIAAGTSQIQRNLIAEHVLGMPR